MNELRKSARIPDLVTVFLLTAASLAHLMAGEKVLARTLPEQLNELRGGTAERYQKLKQSPENISVDLVSVDFAMLEESEVVLPLTGGERIHLRSFAKKQGWHTGNANTYSTHFTEGDRTVMAIVSKCPSNETIHGTITMWDYTPRGAFVRMFALESLEKNVHVFMEINPAKIKPAGKGF